MPHRQANSVPAPARLLGGLVQVRKGEGALLGWSMGYFFFLLFSYYLLRPMREAFGIAKGADKLPWLMTGTMVVMFLANPLFASVVSHLPRRRFIPLAYRFCAASLGLFYLLFRMLPGHGGPALGYTFYIWLSVFNLFTVSVFWAFMTDTFNEEQGMRLFSVIAVGGTLGGILGAACTGLLTTGFHLAGHAVQLQATSLLLLAIVALECAVQCASRLLRRVLPATGASRGREPGPGIFEGLRLFSSSPYLLLIGSYILLFTITSTLLYMVQGQIVARTFTGQVARTAAFARIDFWVNVVTLFSQVFLASRIIGRLGMRATLCLMPLLTAAGFGALWAWPAFATLVVFQVLRRGLHYAVDRPAREMLFIPLGPEEKFKAKPFIDTFVYRSGDLMGTWTPAPLAMTGIPIGAAAMGISALWFLAGHRMGSLQRQAAARQDTEARRLEPVMGADVYSS